MATAKFTQGLSLDVLDQLLILGDNIRRARRARGWSQDEAAHRFLMSKSTLVAIEHGDPRVGIGAYLAALDVMGIAQGIEVLGSRDPMAQYPRR